MKFIARSDKSVLETPTGKKWHNMVKAGYDYDAFIEWVATTGTGEDPIKSTAMARSASTDLIEAAEKHTSLAFLPPFTALNGLPCPAALRQGLSYESKLGTNPFKFGLIGSTDAHNGIPSSSAFFFRLTVNKCNILGHRGTISGGCRGARPV
jgi:hypothetical protein